MPVPSDSVIASGWRHTQWRPQKSAVSPMWKSSHWFQHGFEPLTAFLAGIYDLYIVLKGYPSFGCTPWKPCETPASGRVFEFWACFDCGGFYKKIWMSLSLSLLAPHCGYRFSGCRQMELLPNATACILWQSKTCPADSNHFTKEMLWYHGVRRRLESTPFIQICWLNSHWIWSKLVCVWFVFLGGLTKLDISLEPCFSDLILGTNPVQESWTVSRSS